VISNSGFHRRRHPECLVDTVEIVIRVIDRNHVAVVLKLLGKRICEPREPSGQTSFGRAVNSKQRTTRDTDYFRIGTKPVSFHKTASSYLMAGGPTVITEHEARDVNRLEVR